MYKFIQRNQKKMLAIFGVLLMIVFIIPNTMKSGSGRSQVPVGRIGKTIVYSGDEAEAKMDLQILAALYPPIRELGGGAAMQHFQERPLIFAMLVKEAERRGMQIPTDFVEKRMEDGLQQLTFERFRSGITQPVTPAEQNKLRPALAKYLLVEALYDQGASAIKVSRPLAQHLMAAPDPEIPVRGVQQVRLNLVDLHAQQFLSSVPAPTPEQIRQQYDKYANVAPHQNSPLATAPSEYGYRVPDRFKIQYLELPSDRVVDAFLKTLSSNDLFNLDIIAHHYYADPLHNKEFRSNPHTQPASAPSTNPTTGPALASADTQPATRPAVAAGPTTKPFNEVLPDLRRRVLLGDVQLEPDASESLKAMQKDLDARLAKFKADLARDLRDEIERDYREYARAQGAGGAPTTTPAGPATGPSDLSAIYAQFAFLEQVADAFERAHGVRPLAHALASEWKSAEDLATLPGLGSAAAPKGPTFAQLIAERAAAHRPPAPASTQAATGPSTGPSTAPTSLASSATTAPVTPTTAPTAAASWVTLLEPSPVLEDTQGNAYVFRVTAFDPEHQPKLEEIEPAIVRDLKSAAAYERAKAEAKKLTEAAAALDAQHKAPETGALPQVAQSSGYHAITTGPISGLSETAVLSQDQRYAGAIFQHMMQMHIPGYPLDPMANFTFIPQVAPLILKLTPTDPHPTTVVNLPAEQKAVAVEIADVQLPIPPEDMRRYEISADAGFRRVLEVRFANDWFDYDNVAARLDYTPADTGDGKAKKT